MKLTRLLMLLVLLACSAVALLAQQATGTLTATGSGSPRLYMASGSVQITGSGTLMVSHSAQVTFSVAAPAVKPGKLAGVPMDTYNSYNGSATVTGANFSVGMYSANDTATLTLTATGTGFAILFGTGTYTNTPNGGQASNGNWTLAPWMKGGNQHLDQRSIAVTIGQLNEVQATGSFSAQSTASPTVTSSPRLYLATGTVTISGSGTLMVSHNAQVTFTGATPAMTPGKLAGKDMDAYNGFNGSATVTGTNFSVGMYSKQSITITATGAAGNAVLFGQGTYTTTSASGQATNGNWGGVNTSVKVQIGQESEAYNINNYK